MYKIGVILFAVSALSQSIGGDFPGGVFKTPYNTYHFYDAKAASNETTPFSGRFRFKVKTGSNASISLSSRPDYNSLEFIIGARHNMETHLRFNGTIHVNMLTPKILSSSNFETFEIYWGKNIFHFVQINEWNNDTQNIMLFKNQVTFPINYIGLKTEPSGEWFVRERDNPRIFDAYLDTMNTTLVEVGNSLRCMVIETKNHSKPIYVHTQSVEQNNYTYVSIPQKSCYNVFVRAKIDAHITLANFNNGIKPVVEFHFRPKGSFNFTYEYNSEVIGNMFIKDLLNDQEYRGYWIEFDENTGQLSIGKIGESPFMSRNVEVFTVDYIGVLTSNGNIGDWLIRKNGACPGNKDDDINTDGFWGEAKVRCYIENPNDLPALI